MGETRHNIKSNTNIVDVKTHANDSSTTSCRGRRVCQIIELQNNAISVMVVFMYSVMQRDDTAVNFTCCLRFGNYL
jgi:hypothetical protein